MRGYFDRSERQAEPVAQGKQKASPDAKPQAQKTPNLSEWRVSGYWFSSGSLIVMLNDGMRSRVLHDPPSYQIAPMSFSVALPEGGIATFYTGSQESGSFLGGKK